MLSKDNALNIYWKNKIIVLGAQSSVWFFQLYYTSFEETAGFIIGTSALWVTFFLLANWFSIL